MSKVTKTNGGRSLTTLPEPAREIWFAGLGAVAVAEKEGGKFFRQLVSEGKRFEKTNLARMEKGFDNVLTTVNARVEDVRAIPVAAMRDHMPSSSLMTTQAVMNIAGTPYTRVGMMACVPLGANAGTAVRQVARAISDSTTPAPKRIRRVLF